MFSGGEPKGNLLPREGLGTSVLEPIYYSLLVCFLAWVFCSLYSSVRKKTKKEVPFSDFLIIFFINFFIFLSCLIGDLVRGWEFSKFILVFFPLVFFIDSFFFCRKMVYKKDTLGWELIFLLSLFLILPLIIYIRVKMGWMPK
jgi:hypothetical protein